MTRLAVIAALSLLASCSDVCGNKELVRLTASDGKLDAVMFERDCGATTDFSTQVSVVPRGASITGQGNVFIADGNHGSVAGQLANIAWIGPDVLRIRYAVGARIFRKTEAANGVDVTYQQARV